MPLLLLLYFLKLKRREVIVSSTLLWKRAVQDLQVNAPFQRLRRNLLLLLQLLALAAILVALAGPVLAWRRGPGQRYVLLIDRSASMNATDVKPSRLDAAKEQAKVFIESMRSGSAVLSARRVRPRDGDRLRPARQGDVQLHVGQAPACWRPSTRSSRATARPGWARPSRWPGRSPSRPAWRATSAAPKTPARLVLFSDGRIEDLDTVVVGADELVFHRIGAIAGQRRASRP